MSQRLTVAEYRAQRGGLSESQFKRLKAKATKASPDAVLVERDGNAYYVVGAAALDAQLNAQRNAEPAPSGRLALRKEAPGVVFGELVDDVIDLEVVLPDHSVAIQSAHSEIAQVAHISSGNRNLVRNRRRQALIEKAKREAVEDFALQEKAYAATMAQLEQSGLNAIGLGKVS